MSYSERGIFGKPRWGAAGPPRFGSFEDWEPDWREARSWAELGLACRYWVTGDSSGHPGYGGRPHPETDRVRDTLLVLNGAGIVTVSSQPGARSTSRRVGQPSEQRPYLDGFGPSDLIEPLIEQLQRLGFWADCWPVAWRSTNRAWHYPVTRINGENVTWASPGAMYDVLPGLADDVRLRPSTRRLVESQGKQFSIVDLTWGGRLGRQSLFEQVASLVSMRLLGDPTELLQTNE